MPFCTLCGKPVAETDRYCRLCGAQQASGRASAVAGGRVALSPRAASTLCYVPWFGWIAALYVLASSRFREAHEVRFHAYQGLYLFVAWLLVDWVVGLWLEMMLGPKIPVDSVLRLLLIVVWIFMLIQTSKGKRYALPVLGELSNRSLQ